MNFLKQFSSIIFLFLITISNTLNAQKNHFNVKDFGAKGDGITDDTDAIKKAKVKVEEQGGTIFFPKGNYISGIIDIKPKLNKEIIFKGEKGTVIQKKINDPINVALFFCEVSKAKLKFDNLILEGNFLKRDRNWKSVNSHTIDVDDPTSGIYVYNVHTLEVNNCEIKNFHGDGIAMYHGEIFKAYFNKIENVSVNGIHTHKINLSDIKENLIKNTGLVFSEIILDNKKQFYNPKKYQTNFGDGILDISKESVISKNKIFNSGRVGIVHDLAQDVGFEKSKVQVFNNEVELDDERVNSNNPPAGMWFEQTATVIVKNNKIRLGKSQYPIATGIRFYNITDKIEVINNYIFSESKVDTNEAIGVFEPNRIKEILINENVFEGNFKSAITFSYEKPYASVTLLKILNNEFFPSKVSKAFLTMSVYRQNNYPYKMIVSGNNIKKDLKLFELSYFGKFIKKDIVSNLELKNNIVNNKLSNEKPNLDFIKVSYE